jgi:WD40 repeat protein
MTRPLGILLASTLALAAVTGGGAAWWLLTPSVPEGTDTGWSLTAGGPLRGGAHRGGIAALALTPDGSWAASGSWDHTIRLWNVDRGLATIVLSGHADAVVALAFSPDGTRLASGSWDGTVRLWDPRTGAHVRTLEGHENFVLCLAWSADGRTLASGGADQSIRVWDAATGKPLHTLRGHGGWVTGVRALPGGGWISGGRNGHVLRWSADAAARPEVVARVGSRIHALRGNVRAVTEDGRLVWQAPGDGELRSAPAHRGPANALDAAEGFLATAGDDNSVRLWRDDGSRPELLAIGRGHIAQVKAVAISRDGKRIVSGGWDNTIRVWSAVGPAE